MKETHLNIDGKTRLEAFNMMLDKHDSLIGINMDVMDVFINRAIEERESDANNKPTN